MLFLYFSMLPCFFNAICIYAIPFISILYFSYCLRLRKTLSHRFMIRLSSNPGPDHPIVYESRVHPTLPKEKAISPARTKECENVCSTFSKCLAQNEKGNCFRSFYDNFPNLVKVDGSGHETWQMPYQAIKLQACSWGGGED